LNQNPLLDLPGLPPFSSIKPEHVEPAIDALLAENRTQTLALLDALDDYTWDNFVQPLEELDDKLNRAWSPVSHMNSVVNSEELRAAYNACLPKLSEYGTEMGQNEQLFRAYEQVANQADELGLDASQRKTLDNVLRDFRLSGVALSEDRKARFKEISLQLSNLTSRYEENILDATNAWSKPFDTVDALDGLPDSALAQAEQTARDRDQSGWLITLDFPSYFPIMTYANDRALRREVYEAFSTRASDQGPSAGKWDNTETMEKILSLRHELAQLLDFDNYAERSLATKMARSADEVLGFLYDLADKSKPFAERDIEALRQFAKDQGAEHDLEAWDMGYYSEKLRLHDYALSQEDLKPYFPETTVIPGLFKVVERLYGLSIREISEFDSWHDDVRLFEIRDSTDTLRGRFYLDLYARQHKRGGAWMDDCITRMRKADGMQYPVAYLTCNLSAPVGDTPALFTHDEVVTIFHEFGHGLHHMLTQIDYPGVSGINGVAWDAVELPSQFMENWCWEKESLQLMTGHYQTGETLPDELFEKMRKARSFQAGMQMVRQLEFSIFDFRMYQEYDASKGGRIYDILQQVRDRVSVVQPPSFNRFAHGFSHIFAGGYAAGYYSYKWAEVLSADAFSLFEERGIFDGETGARFLHSVLERGGSRDAMDLFVEFRGREPNIDALLRHNGIAA
jgi:oligopeptidase A